MEAPAKDTNRYFEEINPNEWYGVEDARTITEADIVNFAGISSDFHPSHMSKPKAAGTDFGRRVAHGNLVFSIAEALVADVNPQALSYGYDDLRFVNPVFIGDTLSVHREIVEHEPYNEDFGRVVYAYDVENQNGETVLVCKHITLVEKQDSSE